MRLLNRPIEYNLNSISVRNADQAFATLWNATVAHMRHCMTEVAHVDNPRTEELRQAARVAAKDLFRHLDSENEKGRLAFVRRHETWLPILHAMTAGALIKRYAGIRVRDAMRGSWDSWAGLIGLSGRDPQNRFLSCVGRLYAEIVKGITVFENQLLTDEKDPTWVQKRGPLYHRAASCGPKQDSDGHKKLAALRGERAWKCYLERIIYNQVYRRVMGVQDFGHLVFIKRVGDRMQHFFPGREVTDVTVRYVDERPCLLEISYNDIEEAVTEVYMHKVDTQNGRSIVECRKTVTSIRDLSPDGSDEDEDSMGPQTRMYSKVQSYETGEAMWIQEDS